MILGTTLTEWAFRRGFRSPFCLILVLESLLLGILMLLGNESGGGLTNTGVHFYLLAALPATAMGLQSATLRRVGRYKVRITYITGTLTTLSEEIVKLLFWIYDQPASRKRTRPSDLFRTSPGGALTRRILLLTGLWIGFASGATFGGFAHHRWQLKSLAFPIGALLLISLIDGIHPLYQPSRLDQKIGLRSSGDSD